MTCDLWPVTRDLWPTQSYSSSALTADWSLAGRCTSCTGDIGFITRTRPPIYQL